MYFQYDAVQDKKMAHTLICLTGILLETYYDDNSFKNLKYAILKT